MLCVVCCFGSVDFGDRIGMTTGTGREHSSTLALGLRLLRLPDGLTALAPTLSELTWQFGVISLPILAAWRDGRAAGGEE